jgi:predicted nucleotidyltransferase
LEQIVQSLKTQYQPEKIILFGSMASASVREWSDIDLVIVKDTPRPFFERVKEVALLCRAPVGVDFLVYTPREFAQMISEKNPFILNEIVRKGKVIYGRQPTPAMA